MNDDAKCKIELLRKLLDTRPTVCLDKAEAEKEQLFTLIRSKMLPVLNSSQISGTGEYLQDIEDVFEELDVFLMLPELIGNHTIGLVNFAGKCMKNWMSPILYEQIIGTMLRDKVIPMVLAADGDSELYAINHCQNRPMLSPDEYRMTGELLRENISISSLLRYYRAPLDERWKNLAISYFPADVDWQSDAVRRLMLFQDEIFVLMNDSNQAKKKEAASSNHIKTKRPSTS